MNLFDSAHWQIPDTFCPALRKLIEKYENTQLGPLGAAQPGKFFPFGAEDGERNLNMKTETEPQIAKQTQKQTMLWLFLTTKEPREIFSILASYIYRGLVIRSPWRMAFPAAYGI
jgi:hypothetical protein